MEGSTSLLKRLLKACERGDIQTVQSVVEESNIDLQHWEGESSPPLHCAARHGHFDLVKYLVEEKGCDVACSDDFGSTPFIQAILCGDMEIIQYLYSKADNDVLCPRKPLGRTALHVACLDNKLKVVKYLLSNGAQPMCQDDAGITPLHMAAGGNSLDVLRYLVEECDCDPACKTSLDKTPLHFASQCGHLKVVQWLIDERNINPSCQDKEGDTPLHVACKFGQLSIVKYLIEEKECDPETKNTKSLTPADITKDKEYMHSDVKSYVKSVINILTATMCRTVVKDLAPYTVTAQATDEVVLGSGSFGEVVKLISKGKVYAGKKFKISARNKLSIMKKVCDEIIRHLRIQHENIVESRSVCFLDGSPYPVLMMELMASDLQSYIFDHTNLPLRQKIRILHDISKGLNYLHNLEPAIVHRDLNARNVLLTHNVCAKISDFGNARIIDLDPEAKVCSHTAFPGTIEYMPPEAQTYHTQVTYGPSLDVFSFGHLSLLVFTQTQVEVLPPSLDATGALSEVIRRKRAFDAVNLDLTNFPETIAIIKMSLHYLPESRPHAFKLVTHFQEKVQLLSEDSIEKDVVSQTQSGLSIASVPDRASLNGAVSMPALQKFPYLIEGGNDLIERTAQQYKKIGTSLLNDKDGSIVAHIKMAHHHKPVPIITEIYERWIRSSPDHSWKRLVQCWTSFDHAVLATEIEAVLTTENQGDCY